MKAECRLAIDNAATSLGLKAPRIDDIEARVIAEIKQMALRDKQAFASMSQNERLAAAGKTVYESAMIEASIDRANAARQIKADAINQGYLDKTAPIVGSNMKAMHHNIAMIADGKGGGIPIETAIKAKASTYMGALTELWKLEKEGSFAGILTTKEGSIALAKEAFGIDSGMPQAKVAWKALEKINGMIADDLRNVGAKIGKLDNYRFPQVQDTLRVLQTTAKEYVDRMMTVVDRGMYVDLKGDMLDDAKMRTFLEEAYVTVASDGHSKSPSEGGHGSTVNRHKAHRMIHYKSHEAYIQAMEWYGAGSLFDQIKSHVSNASRDITLMEKFGPNAEYAFKRMMAEAVGKDTRAGVHKPNLETKVQWIFDSMNGKQNIVNANIAQGFSNLRSMIVANKLGSLLFAQTSDLATVKATAEAIGVHMSEVMSYAAKFATDAESRAMIASIGHGLDAVSNGVVRFADAADTTSIFGKAATAVVTIQGAQAWTNILRQAFAATMHSHYGRLTRQYASLADLPTQDRLVLESKGVTETDWKLWKSSGVDDGDILSWRNINQITTADILKANPEIKTEMEANAFRDQSAMKLQAMVVEETHMAVLQPSLSSQYGLSVKNRGDVVSEIGGMVFMFKNFPWALLQQHFIERANFAASGKSPAWYRAKLAAYATVTGGITLMLADLATGKNPRPMDTTEQKLKFIRDSMVRGGAMPILTDVFEAGSAENPTLVVAKAMGGPSAGLLGSTAGAIQGGGKWAISGFEDEKARVQFTKNAYKMAKETVPGQNLWFARGALHNVMLDDVQEMANPGSTQRAKEQLRKRTGQEYFLGME